MYSYVMSVLRENMRCITGAVPQNYYVDFSDQCRYDFVMFLTLYNTAVRRVSSFFNHFCTIGAAGYIRRYSVAFYTTYGMLN